MKRNKMLIIDNLMLLLDDAISDNFTKYIYPITPEECKNYAEIMCGIPFSNAIDKYGIQYVAKKIEEAMLSEIEMME